MAYKSFTKLSSRNQSSLVSQLQRMIAYYGEIFSSRERIYLKNLSKTDGSIYWLEDDEKKLIAAAIVDPSYVFKSEGVTIKALGHTVSKRPGQMDRILNHIFTDNENFSMGMLSRPTIAASIQNHEFRLVPFSPVDLIRLWPELANTKTDYFNITKETLVEGMNRKNHHMYIRFIDHDLKTIKALNPELYSYVAEYYKEHNYS